jgi:hypothetical protein
MKAPSTFWVGNLGPVIWFGTNGVIRALLRIIEAGRDPRPSSVPDIRETDGSCGAISQLGPVTRALDKA